jgi:RNA polymerase sigma-70 factor (ECF subfamily)
VLHVVDDEGEPPDAPDPIADRQVTGVVDRMAIDAALDALPEEFRAAVVLRDVADLDYAEIADALGVPVGTVKSRIARGRAQLTAALGNHEPGRGRPTATDAPSASPPQHPRDAP